MAGNNKTYIKGTLKFIMHPSDKFKDIEEGQMAFHIEVSCHPLDLEAIQEATLTNTGKK